MTDHRRVTRVHGDGDFRNTKRHVQIRTNDVPNIIGVDPGGTCGIAMFNVKGFTSFQLPGREAGEFISDRAKRLTILSNVIIGCQRFTIVGGSQTQQPQALQTIGELTALTNVYRTIVLELQNSADAVSAGPRDVLVRLGWWRPRLEHANDAARHVALTMLRYFPVMWYELIHVLESKQ